jgi:hypothetical protein
MRIEEHRVGLRRQLPHEQIGRPSRHRETGQGAGAREHQALHELLPGKAPPRRPERQADAEFVAPRCRARKKQIGDVGARNQQDERDDSHDRQNRGVRNIVKRNQSLPQAAVFQRVL